MTRASVDLEVGGSDFAAPVVISRGVEWAVRPSCEAPLVTMLGQPGAGSRSKVEDGDRRAFFNLL
ncbi:hypothetical protein LFM09_47230 [Lentzea alba]|uniref:hypothetical protein n=1 Tax=Lentzea alba TaxID=2714351 RepID=UPI0039BFAA33